MKKGKLYSLFADYITNIRNGNQKSQRKKDLIEHSIPEKDIDDLTSDLREHIT